MAKVEEAVTAELEHLVLTIVRGVVDDPDKVTVNIVPASYRCIVELTTAREDVGAVVGRKGSVIEPIRAILRAFGGKQNVGVDLDYITDRMNR